MEDIESIGELAAVLGDRGPFNPDVEYTTGRELAEALIEYANAHEVYAQFDDYLGLRDDLSAQFLDTSLSEIEQPQFEPEIETLIDLANHVFSLTKDAEETG